MVKLLFVCMGNICRSPTAHGVMQHKVNESGWRDHIYIDSAGTHAYHVGEKSDPRSRAKASEKGIDMEFIRARKITINDYDEFDYILAMDHDNLDLILRNAPSDYSATVLLFLDFARKAGLTDREAVPDPYYGGDHGFDDVFELVDLGCNAIMDALKQDSA